MKTKEVEQFLTTMPTQDQKKAQGDLRTPFDEVDLLNCEDGEVFLKKNLEKELSLLDLF